MVSSPIVASDRCRLRGREEVISMMWSNGIGWWTWLTMGSLVIGFWIAALLLVLAALRTW
jgi:hypothetical protein